MTSRAWLICCNVGSDSTLQDSVTSKAWLICCNVGSDSTLQDSVTSRAWINCCNVDSDNTLRDSVTSRAWLICCNVGNDSTLQDTVTSRACLAAVVLTVTAHYKKCLWGAGIAQWLERRTRDRKVAGSNPLWSSGRKNFSRVNFLC